MDQVLEELVVLADGVDMLAVLGVQTEVGVAGKWVVLED